MMIYRLGANKYLVSQLNKNFEQIEWNEIKDLQEDFELIFDNFSDLISFSYYQLYPFVLQALIRHKKIYPMWINPVESTNISYAQISQMPFSIGGLVNSIERIGMIFPLIGFNYIDTDKYCITLGKHRWMALKSKKINKNFLAVFWKTSTVANSNELQYFTESSALVPIPQIDRDNLKIYVKYTNTMSLIATGFSHFSDSVGCEISLIKNIKPHKFFNDKNEFDIYKNL